MSEGIEKVRTPEEEELQQKLEEFATLEAELAEKELALATLATELKALESRYMRLVGARFAELDLLNARIAEVLAKQRPGDQDAKAAARTARERAEQTARETAEVKEPDKTEAFVPSKEIQELYRKLAKKVHPDLAVDEEDRRRRTSIMAEVNRAYSEGDIDRLQAILREWEAGPEAIEGEGVAARLVRTIRMIARVRDRLKEIESEMELLIQSDIHELRFRVEEAARDGRDLIEEMAGEVSKEISKARDHLNTLESEA